MIEAGIVDQSDVQPVVRRLGLPGVDPAAGLGISAWYAWAFVIGHSVWSIAIPIALVELLSLTAGIPGRLAGWRCTVGLRV